jgi:hypothetical protein
MIGSYDTYICIFIRNLQIAFQSGCPMYHSHQESLPGPVSRHLHQLSVLLVILSHSKK